MGRFPVDFSFQLTADEFMDLRFQYGTSSLQNNGTLHGGRRYRPHAFTEHGCLMAANIVRSPQAVEMSVFVVRAFVLPTELWPYAVPELNLIKTA